MAEEFRGEEFECLGENTEKYISFSVPIKIERDNDSGGTITYKIKFIDSCRFMPSKLSNLVDDNLTEIKKFCALRAKTYTYSMDDDSENIKDKGVKRCIVKRRLMFEKYKDSLFNNKTIMWSQLRFNSDHHNVYTEELNKIALNSSDNKRLQAFDRITIYPCGTNAFKVCENEMLSKIHCKV